MKQENRDIVLNFRVTPSELERIRRKMEQVGIQSLSAYLRKMAMNGYCIKPDYATLKETVSLLRRCSNNLNQYAKQANTNGSIYAADIQDLQLRLDEIWKNQKETMRIVAGIK